MNDDLFYTVPEVAHILRMSSGNVYTLVKLDKIPNVKIGRRYVIPRKLFEEWLLGVLPGYDGPAQVLKTEKE